MDFGLLFRKRTGTSQQFVRILGGDRTNFLHGEAPVDILISYIFALLIAKTFAAPLENSQLVCQIFNIASQRSFFRSVLLPSLIDGRRRNVFFAGIGFDLLSNLVNIITENLIYDQMNKGKSRYWKKKNLTKNGLIAKFVAFFLTFPMDLLRLRIFLNRYQQTSLLSTRLSDAYKDIYSPMVLLTPGYGFKPAAFRICAFIILKGFFMNRLKQIKNSRSPFHIRIEGPIVKFSTNLMMDYLSGAVAEYLLFPLSVVITKMMYSGLDTNFIDTVRSIWQKRGLKGFYSGFGYHFGQSLAIYFGTMIFFTLSRVVLSHIKASRLNSSIKEKADNNIK